MAAPQPAQAQSAPPAAATATERPTLDVTGLDSVGEPTLHFFTKDQFAALRRLGDLLLPPNGSVPGAVAAEAPEFLDFYLSQSTSEHKQRYQMGLDRLNQEARNRRLTGFGEIDPQQAAPLLVSLLEPWTYHPPKDEFARFLREAKDDFFRATVNSKQYADVQSGRRRGAGQNPYWHLLD